jgi:hypothetical protein
LGSKTPETWKELTIEESGGFAGLLREAGLSRDKLDAKQADKVTALLQQLGPASPRAKSQGMADAQQLKIQAQCDGGMMTWAFDTSELPEPAAKLLEVAPQLRVKPIG